MAVLLKLFNTVYTFVIRRTGNIFQKDKQTISIAFFQLNVATVQSKLLQRWRGLGFQELNPA